MKQDAIVNQVVAIAGAILKNPAPVIAWVMLLYLLIAVIRGRGAVDDKAAVPFAYVAVGIAALSYALR